MRWKVAVFGIGAVVLVCASVVLAEERLVPSEYSTIQAAINDANNGDEIVVADGVYTGPGNRDVDFNSLAITVRSQNGPTNCIIDCNSRAIEPHRAFIFQSGEGPDSVVCGFTITGGNSEGWGYDQPPGLIVCMHDCRPKITNCVFRDNMSSVLWALGGDISPGPYLINCTLYNNNAAPQEDGIIVSQYTPHDEAGGITLRNCILWQNTPADFEFALCCKCGCGRINAEFSILKSGWQSSWWVKGKGIIVADPCFADPCGGDYHLKSQAGRWDANSESWVIDSNTSLCIDGGDPNSWVGYEPFPNGAVINMGAYGGTAEASKSFFGPQLVGIDPTEFEFDGTEDGPNPESQVLSIYNAGDGTLSWEITADCNWLQVDPNIGESDGEIDDVNVSIDISGLDSGTYSCKLTISDPRATNSPQAVDVTLFLGARVLHVPSEYPTIQAAIDDCNNGDIVIIAEGTYTGAGNRDLDFGGKLITVQGSNPDDPNVVATTVIDCQGSGRGFHFHSGEGPDSVVAGLTITNGSASWGAGMYCYGSSPTIEKCKFSFNTASMSGGGMENEDCSPTVRNCIFADNGASWSGGAMENINCSATVKNCIFSGNNASSGGGIVNVNSSATITNCTFSGNSAGQGGGIYNDETSSASVSNCILWDDSASDGAEIYGDCSASYCDVQGSYGGTGNIDVDPCFVSGPEGDYYLSQVAAGQAADSPCVDAGSDSAVNLGIDIYTTRTDEIGDGGIVDMGYHYAIPNPADIDRDGGVDWIDYAILADQWRGPPGVPSADIAPPGGDGIVDEKDLELLARMWLSGKE